MIIPEVKIGVIPSSMSIPRLEARITCIQYSGSDESEDSVEGHLQAYRENKECYGCPENFLVERDP